MTNALTFLGIAVVIAVVGSTIVTLVHRSRHSVARSAADEFRRVMDALAPDPDAGTPGDRSSRSDDGATRGT